MNDGKKMVEVTTGKGGLRCEMGEESAWNIHRYTVCGPMRHRHSAVEECGQRTCRTSSWGPLLPEVNYSLLTGHELAIRCSKRRGKGEKIEGN